MAPLYNDRLFSGEYAEFVPGHGSFTSKTVYNDIVGKDRPVIEIQGKRKFLECL